MSNAQQLLCVHRFRYRDIKSYGMTNITTMKGEATLVLPLTLQQQQQQQATDLRRCCRVDSMCYSSDAAVPDIAAPAAPLQGTRSGDASHDVQQQLWPVIGASSTA